jgi:hypothetical protein
MLRAVNVKGFKLSFQAQALALGRQCVDGGIVTALVQTTGAQDGGVARGASDRKYEMPDSTAKQDRADRKLAKYISRRNLAIGIIVLAVVILTAIFYGSFSR